MRFFLTASMALALTLTQVQAVFAKTHLKVLHYNLKELETNKLSLRDPQIQAVRQLLSNHTFDLISINELDYDLPDIPPGNLYTGQNGQRLLELIGHPLPYTHFFQANTGKDAQKNTSGHYGRDRALADPVNFGLYPGQYSTFGGSRFPILNQKVIHDLKWRDFNPQANPSAFTTPDGKPLPQDMPLFDKNLNHFQVKVDGKLVNVVLLHTVPAYHFGNDKSPNYERNRDQLRFLEWYLSGQTDISVALPNIQPLPKGATFIAMGDWNVAPDSQNPGTNVLQRLFQQFNWVSQDEGPTHVSETLTRTPHTLWLDYVLTSNNIKKVRNLRPTLNFELAIYCGQQAQLFSELPPVKDKPGCVGQRNPYWQTLTEASDHLPLMYELAVD